MCSHYRNSNTSDNSPEVHSRRCDRLSVMRSFLEIKYNERNSSSAVSVVVKRLLGSYLNFTGEKLVQKPDFFVSIISKYLYFNIRLPGILRIWTEVQNCFETYCKTRTQVRTKNTANEIEIKNYDLELTKEFLNRSLLNFLTWKYEGNRFFKVSTSWFLQTSTLKASKLSYQPISEAQKEYTLGSCIYTYRQSSTTMSWKILKNSLSIQT